ncbi:MAG: HAD family hydrolase [Psychrobacillus psychrodurans]
MAIIFDLDQTLIDSKEAEYYRSNRQWSEVYKMVPFLTPFEGVNEIVKEIMAKDIPFAVVTSSPSTYCKRVLNQWGWEPNSIVCFHDTNRRKPHPDPYLKAITTLNIDKKDIIAIGDNPSDIIAAKRAEVTSIGVTWGIDNHNDLIASNPDMIFHRVAEFAEFISNRYNLKK